MRIKTDLSSPTQAEKEIFDKYSNDCEKEGFRDFSANNPHFERVYNMYNLMHTNQTYDYVKSKHKEWLGFNHGEYTVMEIVDLMDGFVDESDPDVDFPNVYHAYQTAEGLRKMFPDLDWMHLCGFVHDLGKVMTQWGEPQWSTVGDTFVIGCQVGESVMYQETTFKNNPDVKNPKYNTKYGIYEPNCGLENLILSWGHDEYLYQVLKNHGSTIPQMGLNCIRFHSFYPWHTGGDYKHLLKDEDNETMEWVLKFNQHDLYTKSVDLPDPEKLKPYYESLIEKYIPGKVKW